VVAVRPTIHHEIGRTIIVRDLKSPDNKEEDLTLLHKKTYKNIDAAREALLKSQGSLFNYFIWELKYHQKLYLDFERTNKRAKSAMRATMLLQELDKMLNEGRMSGFVTDPTDTVYKACIDINADGTITIDR